GGARSAAFGAGGALSAVRGHRADAAHGRRLFPAALLVAGLGATNHTFMAVWAIAFVAFAVMTRPGLLKQRGALAIGGAAFAAGLLPYLYLPIRSRQDPVLDWGNPETLGSLIAVVTRRDFWDRRFLEGPADLVPIAADFLKGFVLEVGLAGVGLALVGVAVAVTSRRRLV